MRSVHPLSFIGKHLLPLVVALLLPAWPVRAQPALQCGCVLGGQAVPPCASGCPDTDGDGLADAWETAGFVDNNCDGVFDDAIDAPLPGADPNRPDIYVVYDYMDLPGPGGHSHKPEPEAIQIVVGAFAARGIALHIHPGHRRLAHSDVIAFDPRDPACPPGAVNFYDLKAQNFDPRRAFTHHYAIWAHNSCSAQPEPLNTGLAEIGGNDLVVSLGTMEFSPGLTEDQVHRLQAGALMHELGHNLRLCHGGPATADPSGAPSCAGSLPGKPNHLSVMNFRFQLTGIPSSNIPGSIVVARWRVDYSHAELPPLNENSLNEAAGISACSTPHSNDITRYACPGGATASGPACGGGDWDCDSSIEPNVSADINGDGVISLLPGAEEWSQLRYAFQCASCSALGASCTQNSQCCSNLCSGGLCASSCLSPGASCTQNSQCCSNLCSDGLCASSCLSLGASCTQNSQCCSNLCSDGLCVSCLPLRASCTQNSQCCSNFCDSSGQCNVP